MKKILTLALTAALALTALAGCGKKNEDDTVIKIAATAVPHEEILEAARPLLEAKGYTLEIKVFDDYVQPNNVVESGEMDANYFQHILYLNQFNEGEGTHLVIAGSIHYEPMGIYPGKESDLTKAGEGTTIAVPNDPTNEARALMLLAENGLIELADGAGINATKADVTKDNGIELIEIEAAQIPRMLGEVSFGVLNGNYALQAGLDVQKDAVASETSDSDSIKDNYVNVIAVKEGNENLPKIKALVEVLKSDDIKKFIEEKYQGSVVAF